MNDFYRRFLTEDGRRLEPETGRYVALGAFGKHPGWDDHIEDLGLDTDSLNLAKRVLYMRGIGGQIDTGAWEKLNEEQRLPAFDHSFAWSRNRQFMLGRMWSSSDGKGRTRYPMIVCAHCIGLPLKWALTTIQPRLLEVERECREAKTAGDVRAVLSAALSPFRNAAKTINSGAESDVPDLGALAKFVSASEFGPQQEGWLRLLYWLQSQAGAFAPGRYELQEDMSAFRAQLVRVPLGAESAAEAIPLWLRFLAGFVDAGIPLFFAWPTDGRWLDIAFGEPATQEFFCLRAARAALPLATEIPYEFEQKFRDRAARWLADFQTGAPPRPLSDGADEEDVGASVTQRWFKSLTGRFLRS
jgi:hypothetical protein